MALIERVTGKQNFEMAGLSVMQSGTMQVRVRGLGSRGRFSFYVSEADSSPSFPAPAEDGSVEIPDTFHTYPGMSLYGEDGFLEIPVSNWDFFGYSVRDAKDATVELLLMPSATSSEVAGEYPEEIVLEDMG